MADEFARIARIAAILGSAPPGVELGIGDDAAVLAPSSERTVVTVDAVIEDVHFRRDWMSFEDVGYRATVAAASDVLAMGARPTGAVAAWTIPSDLSESDLDAIARGQREAADALGMAVIGGNLTSGRALSITTTVFGAAAAPIARRGARPGDALVVRGVVGEAALGIAALSAGRADVAPSGVLAYRRPRVLRADSEQLAAIAHAMIDVSDGLAQDVGHVARASGVRVVIDEAALARRRSPAFAGAAAALGLDPSHLELAGGDDYALVAAVPADAAGGDAIGFIEEGEGVEILRAGRREPPPRGYVHGERG